MTTTKDATFQTMYAELEYWDSRTGAELLIDALRAAGDIVIPESVHVYSRDVLTCRGDIDGELSIWLSIGLTPGYTPRDFFTVVRKVAQIRVKEAGYVPSHVARGTADEFWAWQRSEWERYEAELA